MDRMFDIPWTESLKYRGYGVMDRGVIHHGIGFDIPWVWEPKNMGRG